MSEETTPPIDSLASRLTAVEHGLRHFREIEDMRDRQTRLALEELKRHNSQQDADREAMETKLLGKIEEISQLLWSGMKWLAGLFASTLLAIALKTLGLV